MTLTMVVLFSYTLGEGYIMLPLRIITVHLLHILQSLCQWIVYNVIQSVHCRMHQSECRLFNEKIT